MHEILCNLDPGARVLDLGCRGGSFGIEHCPAAFVVRLDKGRTSVSEGGVCVQADAARLPFPDACFDAVIANHSLEHMHELGLVLREIGRVVKREGSLCVTVPDASTFSDRAYRWVYYGGGHVNLFVSLGQVCTLIAAETGLTLVATRVLLSSFSFLNKSNLRPRPTRRLWLFGNGNRKFLAVLSFALRILDRLLGTRMSVYGWALYFGDLREAVDKKQWTNVCVGCGSGHPSDELIRDGLVHRSLVGIGWYRCPACASRNLFTTDVEV